MGFFLPSRRVVPLRSRARSPTAPRCVAAHFGFLSSVAPRLVFGRIPYYLCCCVFPSLQWFRISFDTISRSQGVPPWSCLPHHLLLPRSSRCRNYPYPPFHRASFQCLTLQDFLFTRGRGPSLGGQQVCVGLNYLETWQRCRQDRFGERVRGDLGPEDPCYSR